MRDRRVFADGARGQINEFGRRIRAPMACTDVDRSLQRSQCIAQAFKAFGATPDLRLDDRAISVARPAAEEFAAGPLFGIVDLSS